MYNSPAADAELALEVLRRGGNVVIDSVEFLREMDTLLEGEANNIGNILLRVNPDVKISYKKDKGPFLTIELTVATTFQFLTHSVEGYDVFGDVF